MVVNARKAMAEYGRAFSHEDHQQILNVLSNAEESLVIDDVTEIKLVMTKVEETSARITAAMLTAV